MIRALLLATGLLVACTEPIVRSVDDLGPFLVLSGRLDSDLVQTTSEDPAGWSGGIVWLVVDDGELGVTVQSTTIEPRLFGYAMWVAAPPALSTVTARRPAPPELRLAATRLAIGLPVLYDGAPPPVDPDALLLWSLGTLPDVSRVFGTAPSSARAVAPGHVVGVVKSDRALGALVDHPGFVDDVPWCRWAMLEPGLALYRDGGARCDGWRSIAYAEEIQGVDMRGVGGRAPPDTP